MPSGFWYLKDGRGFAKRVQAMFALLEEIVSELESNKEAKAFANYLRKYIPTEKHELNGYGGFYDKENGENTMMVIDFREFTLDNQRFFWEAAQRKVGKLIKKGKKEDEILIMLLKELLDMNKRANNGEDPMKLNSMSDIEPPTGLKKGPGWNKRNENKK